MTSKSVMKRTLHRVFLLNMGIMLALAGCNPFYVIRAAYEESRILLRRQEIDAVIADPKTPADTKEKLAVVIKARNFALKLGLNPGESFTKYSHVNKDVLAWVLVASKPDSFTLFRWWFPVVGYVPYKGFFDKSDALKLASILEEKGYETWVRGTEAFSTLGWFNDPVLSTTIKRDEVRIVNTVLHETTHTTVWIPGYVDFNESLGNFIGVQGCIDYYKAELAACPKDSAECSQKITTQLERANITKVREFELGDVISALYQELATLYSSNNTLAEKLKLRDEIFAKHIAPLREKYPTLEILKNLNNAEVMQLKLYLTGLKDFEALFQKNQGNWPLFLAAIKGISEKVAGDSALNPYVLLAELK